MNTASSSIRTWPSSSLVVVLVTVIVTNQPAHARPSIRDAFFTVYPDAIGTPIETVPSQPNHCGVCHYDFTGGGPRNPYGIRLGNELPNHASNPNGRREAVRAIELEDPDGDGFSTVSEVTNTTTFGNTPTFPGLTPANVGQTSSVTRSEIQPYLVPSTGSDTTPPSVTVITPNGGEILVGNAASTVTWTATDTGGIAVVDIYLSVDDGSSYQPIALGLTNTGTYTWYVPNRPTLTAYVRVVATDNAFNTGHDESDNHIIVESPPGGLAPTTLRDFDLPGSKPFDAGTLNPPEACAVCHGNYDPTVEPYFNWGGSMMAQASRDLLFQANMVIANQDAPDSGDLCLRCHLPRGWLRGRSVPTDGSQMLIADESGVSCDFCHRLVDPFYEPVQNPLVDADILAALALPPTNSGLGMYVVDPTGGRRGPFANATSGHAILVSPFHREAALCGTCHDVSNPAFEKDGNGNYVPNDFDAPATDFSSHTIAPVERTYSEWFYSAYNSPEGIYAPQFGGNKDFVATCQDCHMRDVTGQGCNFGTPPTRSDLPLHDMTGGSTWLPGLLPALYPGAVDPAALQAGIERARYMLQNAATLEAAQTGADITVTVTNETGHKLPTGYPEGRRVWINVKFYDADMVLLKESAAYDGATGELGHDAEAKIYHTEPGLDEVTAPLVGVDPGPSLHFVLNNRIFLDNRIPPRGFVNSTYGSFGGAPVAHTYADGQYWDDTSYAIPPGATSARVTLYYQSTSKEFVEFLRDENTTNSKGQDMYDLWNNNGKCPPEEMRQVTLGIDPLYACCGPEDGCTNVDSTSCATTGGTFHPDQVCTAPEACCLPGQCLDLDPVCCLAQGGVPQGSGTVCATALCPECVSADECDDSNACTTDTCEGGMCVHTDTTPAEQCCDPITGTLTPIDDGNDCTDDVCNPDGTVSHSPSTSGTPCDDGDPCTLDDACNGSGDCTGTDPTTITCVSDGNCPSPTRCDVGNGHCVCGPGACCLPDGSCTNVTEAECVAVGGSPKLPGSTCVGDGDGNGTDDACEPDCLRADPVLPEPAPIAKNRYLTILPTNAGRRTAIRVTPSVLPAYPTFEGEPRWVGPPTDAPEEDSSQPGRTFRAAQLVCTPHFRDWGTVGLLQVYGGELIPSAVYDVDVVDESCSASLDDPANYAAPLPVLTGKWGDVTTPFDGEEPGVLQPDFKDISAVVQKFQSSPTAPIKALAQLQPNVVFPMRSISFKDIAAAVTGFLSVAYEDVMIGPCVCPSTVPCGVTSCQYDLACSPGYCIDGFCTDPCGRCTQ